MKGKIIYWIRSGLGIGSGRRGGAPPPPPPPISPKARANLQLSDKNGYLSDPISYLTRVWTQKVNQVKGWVGDDRLCYTEHLELI